MCLHAYHSGTQRFTLTIGTGINDSLARSLLIRTAHGDAESLAALYDLFSSDTYAVCAHYLPDQPQRESTMAAVWSLIWTDARRLAARPGTVRDLLVITAHAQAGAAAEVVAATFAGDDVLDAAEVVAA